MRAALLLLVLASLSAEAGGLRSSRLDRRDRLSHYLNGSQSFPITTTRASVAYFSGDDEYVYSAAVNTPRETGVKGVLSFEARTNLLPNTLDATAWTVSGTGVVTPNVSSGIFSRHAGGAEVDRLTDDDPAVFERIQQTITVTAGTTYNFACYLASDTTSAPTLNAANGTGTCATTCNLTTTSSIARYSCAVAATVSGTCEFRVFPAPSSSAANVGSILFDGCQVEAASFAGPPLPCQASACSTNADVHTTPTPSWLSRTEGCAKVCVRPENWSGAPNSGRHALHGNAAGTARFGYINSAGTDYAAHNGTSTAGVAHSLTAGAESCFLTQWSATQNKLQVTNLTTSTAGTAAAFTTFPAFDASLTVGSFPGNINHLNGWVRLVKLGAEWGACQ